MCKEKIRWEGRSMKCLVDVLGRVVRGGFIVGVIFEKFWEIGEGMS